MPTGIRLGRLSRRSSALASLLLTPLLKRFQLLRIPRGEAGDYREGARALLPGFRVDFEIRARLSAAHPDLLAVSNPPPSPHQAFGIGERRRAPIEHRRVAHFPDIEGEASINNLEDARRGCEITPAQNGRCYNGGPPCFSAVGRRPFPRAAKEAAKGWSRTPASAPTRSSPTPPPPSSSWRCRLDRQQLVIVDIVDRHVDHPAIPCISQRLGVGRACLIVVITRYPVWIVFFGCHRDPQRDDRSRRSRSTEHGTTAVAFPDINIL